jgi:flagellar hook protein FlgE
VLAFDAGGALVPVSIADLKVNLAAVTTNVTFGGNLTTGSASQTVSNVTIYDRAGTAHTLSVRFDAVTGTNDWTVTVLDTDGTTAVATGQISFNNGVPVAGQSQVAFDYNVNGQAAIPITLDFSKNVTSYGSGTTTTLAMSTQDGHAPGSLTGTAFDETGSLVLSYSNGQTVHGVRLALARFDSADAVRPLGNNRFEAVDPQAWTSGYAGSAGFGSVKSAVIEMSNVDLSSEFSDLVIMQRGYQAASQVVSTANEMLAQLFSMKGNTP